jgi:alcohol dehydrogenase class IV
VKNPGAPFRWQDGERLILFGRQQLDAAPEVLGQGYTLLTTARASASAPAILAGAASVHEVEAGRVDELAAGLREVVQGELLVALGGGRVIDTAKALAAADQPRRVAAIPTTLSGAEMTPVHRHATGVAAETPRVRPAIVINDPAISASQPVPELAQSAANALAHAAEGPLTPLRNPIADRAAWAAAELIGAAFAPGTLRRRAGADAGADAASCDALALAALLAGYVIGSTWYGLHHVLSQTLVRTAGISHGVANSVMLPHTLVALTRRNGDALGDLADHLGEDPAEFARALLAVSGVRSLREAGVEEATIGELVEQAVTRPELAMTPPAADADEIRGLYEAAMTA